MKTWENFLPLRKQLNYSELCILLAPDGLLEWGHLGKYWKQSNLTRSFRKSIDLPKWAAIDMFKVSIVCIPVFAVCIHMPFESKEETPLKNQI